jgi:DHA2 family lincomycin resistance protein-like MFS transporter
MAALLVAALVVRVVFVVMMKKHGFSADRAKRIRTYAWPSGFAGRMGIRRKLMSAYTAKIFLVSVFIFAITIKVLMVVAFPQLTASLHVSTSTVQWLATAYMLIIGISVPAVALLLETFTTKKLYLIAMTFFFVGTVFCGLSNSFPMLLIFRMVQGIGTGMLIPIMMNTILAIYPQEKRGLAIGLSTIVIVVAPAIGPTLSGLVLQFMNWHWLFFLILPIAVIAMIIGSHTLLNVSGLSKPKIDVLSLILSTVGFGGLIFGICSIESIGLYNAIVIISLLLGICGLIFFIRRQFHLKQPMLELRLFRYPMFSLGTVLLFISFMIPFSLNIILPTYLQSSLGLTPFAAGLALLPGGIVCGILAPISGHLFDKIGAKPLAIAGFAILTIVFLFFSHITAATSLSVIIILHICSFIGTSLINTPTQTNTLNQLPYEYNAHGVSITNTVQQIASAFGSSLFIGLMGAVQENNLSKMKNPNVVEQHRAIISGVDAAFTAALIMVAIALVLSFFIKAKDTNKNDESYQSEKINITSSGE